MAMKGMCFVVGKLYLMTSLLVERAFLPRKWIESLMKPRNLPSTYLESLFRDAKSVMLIHIEVGDCTREYSQIVRNSCLRSFNVFCIYRKIYLKNMSCVLIISGQGLHYSSGLQG